MRLGDRSEVDSFHDLTHRGVELEHVHAVDSWCDRSDRAVDGDDVQPVHAQPVVQQRGEPFRFAVRIAGPQRRIVARQVVGQHTNAGYGSSAMSARSSSVIWSTRPPRFETDASALTGLILTPTARVSVGSHPRASHNSKRRICGVMSAR
ncbi:hypothetical protein [Jiangella asiatica]|uniref:Uncharacterized protein n=1 Tax=Jiangella asiatica TaxID=2530372 RepID=A0A4R5DT18_9ACTN|nr:hypothetical protein [Jiangella asiatica]TDE14275.1 hypothetical protein E1269_03725 [Jiangella asiatica]